MSDKQSDKQAREAERIQKEAECEVAKLTREELEREHRERGL